ncbi:sporulation protein [Bacillus methanolicus]|uniref:sigma-G-dependent sporulation-specific acid-soluble spore protein CsgA n=1 Tax=Bacillus methanolicus TaxID=1471 RepID=UPI00237FE0DF|nr:sigma-G-dependent sporulation-specific acid-soluble spore protein CsgA [Bacillus methanolicus]MDE3838942.1 sporulation protein [Bacillus methanolicus]
MDKTLGYLREIVSNYTEQSSLCKKIYEKIEKNLDSSEEDFVRKLSQKEINYLNEILPQEIRYAKDEKDNERVRQLNEVYELLF